MEHPPNPVLWSLVCITNRLHFFPGLLGKTYDAHECKWNQFKLCTCRIKLQDIDATCALPRHVAIPKNVFRHVFHGLGQSVQQVLQTFRDHKKSREKNMEEQRKQYFLLQNEVPWHHCYKMPCFPNRSRSCSRSLGSTRFKTLFAMSWARRLTWIDRGEKNDPNYFPAW